MCPPAALDPEQCWKLNTAAKLDPSNAVQLETLHAYFSHNQAAVDFWLAHCLLPREVQHYPCRLASSAWDLADNRGGTVRQTERAFNAVG